MKCKMRYIYMLCLFCALSSCSEDAFRSYGEGKGRLLLDGVKIEMEAQTEVATRGSYNAPALSDLTYKVTNTQTGEVVYDQPGQLEYLILDEGSYSLEAVYGVDEIGTTPYLYGKKEFVIIRARETALGEFPVSLNSAIVHPAMTDDLLRHYEAGYTLKLSDGTTTVDIANNADLYVPAGKDYNLTFSGINKLGETKTNTWSLNGVAASTRYTVNCNPDLPSFKLPDNVVVEGDVWSKYIYITNQMTAADMNSKPEMADKVLANIVYEASSDDVNWIPAVEENGRLVIKGLTPSTNYRIRSRFGEVVSVSTTEPLMTESAQQLENGDMEKWDKVLKAKSYSGEDFYNYYVGTQDKHIWNTNNDVTLNGATTHATNNVGTYWRWCAGTTPTSDAKSGTAAEISTLAFYTEPIKGNNVIWGLTTRSNVHNWIKDKWGKCSVGKLYTGTDQYGVAFASRPTSLSFDYKYVPVEGDNTEVLVVLYDNNKQILASHSVILSQVNNSYQTEKITFVYKDINQKAGSLYLYFQSGHSEDFNLMSQVEGGYNASPWSNDRVVGSVLKIDNVVLNYE